MCINSCTVQSHTSHALGRARLNRTRHAQSSRMLVHGAPGMTSSALKRTPAPGCTRAHPARRNPARRRAASTRRAGPARAVRVSDCARTADLLSSRHHTLSLPLHLHTRPQSGRASSYTRSNSLHGHKEVIMPNFRRHYMNLGHFG